MANISVLIYRAEDGCVPFLDWLDSQSGKVADRAFDRIEQLENEGYRILLGNRNRAAHLRDGIHELRFKLGRANYRILFFFHENWAAVVSHGITKEDRVPPHEIDRACQRRKECLQDIQKYTVPR